MGTGAEEEEEEADGAAEEDDEEEEYGLDIVLYFGVLFGFGVLGLEALGDAIE